MDYHLPETTNIGFVDLKVSSLSKSLEFYQGVLGFTPNSLEPRVTALQANGAAHPILYLTEVPGAIPKPPRTTGLYHVAIRFPNRAALGQVLQRLLKQNWRIGGVADHGVSEALYTSDADGNGIELYVDRPREQWSRVEGRIQMSTDPLDIHALLQEGQQASNWAGAPSGTDIGHVHLQVRDLRAARAFYTNLLGLDVTQDSYPGALFLSSGGYHHHLGLNIWAGQDANPAPENAVGMRSFAICLPDGASWRTLHDRLVQADISTEEKTRPGWSEDFQIHDPDGNRIEVVAAPKGE